MSPLTINRKISSLSKYYDFLIKIENIKTSPLKHHKRLKVQKTYNTFSEDEILKIACFQKILRKKKLANSWYSTGIRRDELINIKINDVLVHENVKVLGKEIKKDWFLLF